MSKLIYNGIEIPYISTQTVEQQAVYDPTNTDVIGFAVTIHVTGILSTAPTAQADRGTKTLESVQQGLSNAVDPAVQLAAIRTKLLTPRKTLWYGVGNSPIIHVTGDMDAPETKDIAKGPTPKVLRAHKITAETFLVEFSIETTILGCDQKDSAILSIRWTQSLGFDEKWICTQTTTGRMITRRDVRKSPDELRASVTPAVPTGFVRSQTRYTLQADGLAMDFEMTDVEQFVMAPVPAIKASGKYLETTGTDGLVYGQVQLRLTGAKNTSYSQLLQRAVGIGLTKLKIANPLGTNGQVDRSQFMVAGTVMQDLFEPTVDISLRAQIKPPSTLLGVSGKDADLSRWDNRGWDPKKEITANTPGVGPGTDGNVGFLRMLAFAFKDPCAEAYVQQQERVLSGSIWSGGGQEKPPVTTQGTESRRHATNSTAATESSSAPTGQVQVRTTAGGIIASIGNLITSITEVASLPAIPTRYEDPDPGVYDHYTIKSRYRVKSNRHVLTPTAPGERVTVLQMGAAVTYLDVTWSCKRTGSPPVVPDPDPGEGEYSNWIPLDRSCDVNNIRLAADGVSFIYEVAGVYHYVSAFADQVQVTAPVTPYIRRDGQLTFASAGATKGRSSDLVWGTTGDGDNWLLESLLD
ncbi:hypothetical protein [Tuwongella immobilis]|uniref:Uncharacterized protein n=1 Tax=Tuwongella immobilis TaxID=692036 RepID=A0A6C2YLD0_9BACT|nr:hypothetical protein [Tuwongella immobilis]VIP02177.1 unnamed protein product [Tuwongella immobilis]VTS00618.1 unnamed protein product [Tuwongella immobilis]